MANSRPARGVPLPAEERNDRREPLAGAPTGQSSQPTPSVSGAVLRIDVPVAARRPGGSATGVVVVVAHQAGRRAASSSSPDAAAAPPIPSFVLIFDSISAAMSGFLMRKLRAFSLPWPSCSPS